MCARNMVQAGGTQQVNNYLEKEVRQHDNLVLKRKAGLNQKKIII